jgi:enoyl-CoA hydratase/carnithine racemase
MHLQTIAAVSGYALGGGCELAMSCDLIIAADSAKFGQPEIALGVIPGCGGTQRLVRAIGKSKAMQLVLTGDMINAEQAERDGLVCRVVPKVDLLTEALKMSDKISSFSRPAVAMAKETVNASYELSLQEGLRFERRIFHSMFSLSDQKEGMAAFIEKRPADWQHK